MLSALQRTIAEHAVTIAECRTSNKVLCHNGKRLFHLMVFALGTGRASGAVIMAVAILYAGDFHKYPRRILLGHMERFKEHFLRPEVIEHCGRSIRLKSALQSVLHLPATPPSDATVSDVQAVINFFREARAAQADKQPVCVSTIFPDIDKIRDHPHCVTLLVAIRQGLSTRLPGCRSTTPPPPSFFYYHQCLTRFLQCCVQPHNSC